MNKTPPVRPVDIICAGKLEAVAVYARQYLDGKTS